MKLYHAPRSPFSFKTRVLVHEMDFASRIDFVEIDPWTTEHLRALNPLCKVPVLCLEDGVALYDSRTICHYLAAAAGQPPVDPRRRWHDETLHALADGLSDAVIRCYVESREPILERSEAVIVRQEKAIEAALDAMESRAGSSPPAPMSVVDIAMGASLTYLDFRLPDLSWSHRRASLRRWFDAFSAKPSVIAADFRVP